MSNDPLQKAHELRELANKLEKEAKRKLPEKWKVGMCVRFLEDNEFAWSKGNEWFVVGLRTECASRKGNEYQVFYTSPAGSNAHFWTTPDDVEWVPEKDRKRGKK